MSPKELVVTIVGLAATFLMPWPGEAGREGDQAQARVLQACACAGACLENLQAPPGLDGLRALSSDRIAHAWSGK